MQRSSYDIDSCTVYSDQCTVYTDHRNGLLTKPYLYPTLTKVIEFNFF